MKKKKRKKEKLVYKKARSVFFLILIVLIIIFIINTVGNNNSIQTSTIPDKLVNSIDLTNYANVDRYIVYGTHFNLEGTLNIKENVQLKEVEIVAKNSDEDEIIIDTEYTYNDNLLAFTTIEEINKGLNLEELQLNNYYLLLKLQLMNNEIKYYSLKNNTEYGDINYYTLTRNGKNNNINIGFKQKDDIPFLELSVKEVNELPNDVYDVVIDPGHGGADGGAVSGNHVEAEIVLESAYELKKQLEEIRFKGNCYKRRE